MEKCTLQFRFRDYWGIKRNRSQKPVTKKIEMSEHLNKLVRAPPQNESPLDFTIVPLLVFLFFLGAYIRNRHLSFSARTTCGVLERSHVVAIRGIIILPAFFAHELSYRREMHWWTTLVPHVWA